LPYFTKKKIKTQKRGWVLGPPPPPSRVSSSRAQTLLKPPIDPKSLAFWIVMDGFHAWGPCPYHLGRLRPSGSDHALQTHFGCWLVESCQLRVQPLIHLVHCWPALRKIIVYRADWWFPWGIRPISMVKRAGCTIVSHVSMPPITGYNWSMTVVTLVILELLLLHSRYRLRKS